MSEKILYDSIALAERIKEQASLRGVTLKDMFAYASLSANTISNLRHGSMMKSDSLAQIADYLDCSMDYLMGRIGDSAVTLSQLTDAEREKVDEYIAFLISQRADSSSSL